MIIDTFTPSNSSHTWTIEYHDLMNYGEALELQKTRRDEVMNGGNHHLILLQHPSVITLGRRTDPNHLVWSESEIRAAGIDLHRVDRGGSATYHGPGQLVGYIICKSSRMGGIHHLVSSILGIINNTMHQFGIETTIDEENPGIWTETEVPRKLAAVGMSNTKGYTMHGFAMNVDLPLTGFSAIVPCGLTLPVSTMAIETGRRFSVDEVKEVVIQQFKDMFQVLSEPQTN